MATSRKLLGITDQGPLSRRDAWAATFEHVLSLAAPRDTPAHMPDAPKPTLSPSEGALSPESPIEIHEDTIKFGVLLP